MDYPRLVAWLYCLSRAVEAMDEDDLSTYLRYRELMHYFEGNSDGKPE